MAGQWRHGANKYCQSPSAPRCRLAAGGSDRAAAWQCSRQSRVLGGGLTAMYNHTTIVGNLVDDPELRFANNGIALANLRIAVTQRIQQDGEWRDGETSFFKVNVWRGQAEHLADSLGKGDRVMVTGRLRQRSWETPEGEKRSVAEIEADEVGASLKFATAKVERAGERGPSDRSQGRERQAERGDFNAPAPF